jgi:hypothetical protein
MSEATDTKTNQAYKSSHFKGITLNSLGPMDGDRESSNKSIQNYPQLEENSAIKPPP